MKRLSICGGIVLSSQCTKIDPEVPYNLLPKLPLKHDLVTKLIMRKLARSRAALAEMKWTGSIIPNPAMLINTLTLLAAKDSSEICRRCLSTCIQLYQPLKHDERSKRSLLHARALGFILPGQHNWKVPNCSIFKRGTSQSTLQRILTGDKWFF